MTWPLKYRAWKRLHAVANWLAWRFARPSGPVWGIALRIDHSRPLWRLNDWLAARWTRWWVREKSR